MNFDVLMRNMRAMVEETLFEAILLAFTILMLMLMLTSAWRKK